MTPDNPRDAALTYAARFGWPVLPTGPDKAPLVRHGVNDASTDPGTIDGWFARWPDANVGIATGAPGPMVLDVDHPELAPAAITGLHANAEAVTGRTDSVGRHLYFAGVEQRTRGWPWGELRGTGSYVVAPPSLHASGQPYRWAAEPTVFLAPIPAAVLELVAEVDRTPFVRRHGVPHGERHGYLQRYAEHIVVVQGFRDEQAIAVELEAEFGRACMPEPPARADEFRSLARWVAGSDLMGRLRRRDAGVRRLTEALAKGRALPARDELVAIVDRYGGWQGKLEIASVVRRRPDPQASLEIRFTNGTMVYFARQDSITTRGHWARIVTSATGGVATPSTTGKADDLIELYRALCLLAGAPLHAQTEAEDLTEEVEALLSLTEPVFGSLADAVAIFDLIARLKARPAWNPRNPTRESYPALVIAEEDRYLRAGDLWAWFQHRGLQIAPAAFVDRMEMVGLERLRFNGREARQAPKVDRRKNTALLYRLPREGVDDGDD